MNRASSFSAKAKSLEAHHCLTLESTELMNPSALGAFAPKAYLSRAARAWAGNPSYSANTTVVFRSRSKPSLVQWARDTFFKNESRLVQEKLRAKRPVGRMAFTPRQ